eukprot:94585-Pleurochrysis_carterae.AAC.1
MPFASRRGIHPLDGRPGGISRRVEFPLLRPPNLSPPAAISCAQPAPPPIQLRRAASCGHTPTPVAARSAPPERRGSTYATPADRPPRASVS